MLMCVRYHTTALYPRLPFSFINKEVSKATCLCLLEEASHILMVSVYIHIAIVPIAALIAGLTPQNGKSVDEVEKAVLEEFGRCMKQIISSAQSGDWLSSILVPRPSPTPPRFFSLTLDPRKVRREKAWTISSRDA